jgi:hypothetical protein
LRIATRSKARAVGALCCALLLALVSFAAVANAGHPSPDTRDGRQSYFVDFRSRPGYLFGHTYIAYGRIDAHGGLHDMQYAGVYPLDGQSGLIIGAVIPVPASVRAVKGDFQPPSNVYRRRLSATEFARLQQIVRDTRASGRQWNLLFNNCNDFAIDIADGLGMTAPPSWLPPDTFIDGLRFMNEP